MKKVSIIGCNNYEFENVREKILESINLLGGLEKFVSPGENVFVKTNLLAKRLPEKAVTTHPVFVAAAAHILTEYGCNITIGDSPGGPFTQSALKGIYKTCGMDFAAEKSGAQLNYNTNTVQVPFEEGKVLKKVTMVEAIHNADKVIDVCKLKTHSLATFTGGVKNLFGVIPGTMKAEYHLLWPSYNTFANGLIDICLCVNPALTLMDGIVGMEGDGPSGGNPRDIGVILASESPFALDMAAVKIINMPYKMVPTINQTIKRGIVKPSDVVLVGEDISQFIIEDYKLPKTVIMNPFLRRGKGNSEKLATDVCFDREKCIGCGVCFENCPPKAIYMENHRPEVDRKKCIHCYCCQELCPETAVFAEARLK